MLPGLINLLTGTDGHFGVAKKTYSVLASDESRVFIFLFPWHEECRERQRYWVAAEVLNAAPRRSAAGLCLVATAFAAVYPVTYWPGFRGDRAMVRRPGIEGFEQIEGDVPAKTS